MLVVTIDVHQGVMMNGEVAEAKGGMGISVNTLFIQTQDIKTRNKQGVSDV